MDSTETPHMIPDTRFQEFRKPWLSARPPGPGFCHLSEVRNRWVRARDLNLRPAGSKVTTLRPVFELNISRTSWVNSVASMLHGIPDNGCQHQGIRGFQRQGLATYLAMEKPAVRRAKLLILLGIKMVAGVGFEPTTFRL